MQQMHARNLEEVQDEIANIELDPKIKDLVLGLRRWGVETTSSCQGHLGNGLPFPIVECQSESLQIAADLLATQYHYYPRASSRREPKAWDAGWIMKPFFGQFSIRPENKGTRVWFLRWWQLHKWQTEAIRFGKFLQELPEDFFEELNRNTQ